MLTSRSKTTDNWLNGPTTLNHAEINCLVNNITFIIRSLQRNAKSSVNVDFSEIRDSDLHIVTAAENGGFRMSIFFGSHLICVGEHVDQREQTMDGLRKKVEKMISSMVNVKAKAAKKHQREDFRVTLQDYIVQGSRFVNGSLGPDRVASEGHNGTAAVNPQDLLPPGEVSTAVVGSALQGAGREIPNGTSVSPVSQGPLNGPSLPHNQGQDQVDGQATGHSQS
ncbi:uncharacterized protein N0V89_003472 [Didymosphaeria variabile]|uniref:Uncharacterized protein n=1 Tax=Didymosphaeria variabile TaxID=1932322 RepID=A0A9W8XPC6_9PLEO|nr:uncharacterized protein N0V89_003472 [Didymosphaeria variabile]KAJ4355456.1 hypothetical protein N0V89_003472 [Didymosphaeria variabile]